MSGKFIIQKVDFLFPVIDFSLLNIHIGRFAVNKITYIEFKN